MKSPSFDLSLAYCSVNCGFFFGTLAITFENEDISEVQYDWH